MAFYQRTPVFDLGELHIENIFVSDFMPSASGNYVKVYLMGLMFSQSNEDGGRLDNVRLAQQLGMPLTDIVEAWRYWESVGAVKKHYAEDGKSFDVEFLSLRDLYIQNNYVSKASAQPPKKTAPRPNHSYMRLAKEAEHLIGHPLSHAEYREIGDFYDHYYKDETIVLKAIAVCYRERNIRSMKAVKKLLVDWMKAQLTTLPAIEAHLKATDARHQVYKEVMKCMGLSFRMANVAEKETIDYWIDEYGFEPETLYAFIVHFSKRNSNLNLNYLKKAFASLHEAGIHTVEAFEKQQAGKSAPAKKNSKNQFTIEKERSYSEEELEELLLNKR